MSTPAPATDAELQEILADPHEASEEISPGLLASIAAELAEHRQNRADFDAMYEAATEHGVYAGVFQGIDPRISEAVITVAASLGREYQRERDAARERTAGLERFVADLATHGLRCDLTPTVVQNDPARRADFYRQYLRDADARLRDAARAWVPTLRTDYTQGRPRPIETETGARP